MKPVSLLSSAAIVAAWTIASPLAFAGQIVGSPAGLDSPAVLITFDPPPAIAMNTVVTDQYGGQGVTFDYLYYNPYDQDNDGSYRAVSGTNYLGNYQYSQADEVVGVPSPDTLTISFTDVQMRAAFGLQSNGGDDNPNSDGNVFTFTAYLGGAYVDSFTASVFGGYYGFYGESFDSITLSSCVPTDDFSCGPLQARRAQGDALDQPGLVSPDYYLLDNLQFGFPSVVDPSGVPEPGIGALFGLGLCGATVMRRRSSRARAV